MFCLKFVQFYFIKSLTWFDILLYNAYMQFFFLNVQMPFGATVFTIFVPLPYLLLIISNAVTVIFSLTQINGCLSSSALTSDP